MEKAVTKMAADFRRLEDMVSKMEKLARPRSYVRNRKTGIVHRVLCGFDEVGADALTYCGWGYGHCKVSLEADAPTLRKHTCKSCLPALRIKGSIT